MLGKICLKKAARTICSCKSQLGFLLVLVLLAGCSLILLLQQYGMENQTAYWYVAVDRKVCRIFAPSCLGLRLFVACDVGIL